MEIWDILDENGVRTGRTIERGKTLKAGEYHLVVHIWIKSSKDEFLVQKRADHLKILPGLWAMTGGSAISGEDSFTAAVREVQEELGISINYDSMQRIGRVKRKNNLVDVWLVNDDIPLDDVVMLEEEVSNVKYMRKEEIEAAIKEGSFHNYGDEYFELLWGAVKITNNARN